MSREDEENMELLSAYIDEELTPAEKRRVELFLATSTEGKKAVDELNKTKALLLSSAAVKAPADFLDALEAQAEDAVAALPARRSFWHRSNPWAWATPFVTASLLLVAGLGLRPQKSISLDTLVAAHMGLQTKSGLHQRVLRAAHYTPPAGERSNAAI